MPHMALTLGCLRGGYFRAFPFTGEGAGVVVVVAIACWSHSVMGIVRSVGGRTGFGGLFGGRGEIFTSGSLWVR